LFSGHKDGWLWLPPLNAVGFEQRDQANVFGQEGGNLRTLTIMIVTGNHSTKPTPRCAQVGTAFQASRIRPCSESAAGSKCRKCIQNRSE